ncbi:spectinomycin phosphotransferase [Paenibacillus sp. UNC496MF]|uniref:phosphotransferase enzyme family protein n=1 Tax=Paenibacillus sp. UNC496MF TaxID=1502753 RepID=UPI0008ED0E2C|nr:aminoglycoside phosphotransferase family protein [Paenibacillus sp. UNC496MF]SFI39774.1 spectinomycin phosphotransferase [Paenibacillus sp. UNC496MF]
MNAKQPSNTRPDIRSAPDVSEQRLLHCLRDRYRLNPVSLAFLPHGHDFGAGVYRAIDEQGTAYLLKASSRPFEANRYLVPAYVRGQGIEAVVAPIPAADGALWTRLEAWTVSVYPYVEGSAGLDGMTAKHWKAIGEVMKRIHQVPPPANIASLREERFDPSAYIRWIREFGEDDARAAAKDYTGRELLACWAANRAMIGEMMASLARLAEALQGETLPQVICHADLHASNVIRGQADRVFVINWDEAMLAPKERDFIFVREPHAAAFHEGYGAGETNPAALSYFLWERIAQDLIECATNACLKPELGEASRAAAGRAVQEMFAGRKGGHFEAVHAANERLPASLRAPLKR